MPKLESEFDQLEQQLSAGGLTALLESAAQQLRDKNSFHELFEVLKMQVRNTNRR